MQYLAIDTGHGYVKGLADSGEHVLLPSWIASANQTADMGSVLRTAHPVTVAWNDDPLQPYWLGDDAARMATSLLMRDKGQSRLTRDLTLLAVQRLKPQTHQPITLAVGLPLAWYREGRRALAQALTGQGIVNSDPLIIEQVQVFPQGVAAVLSVLRPDAPRGLYGLIDVGYGTVDYLMVELTPSGQPRLAPEPSGTWELGIHQVNLALMRHVATTWQVDYAPHELDHRSQITVRGRIVDLTSVRTSLISQWRESIVEHVQAVWSTVLPRLQGLVVIGGAAPMFVDMAMGTMPVTVPDDAQWANVQGYLRAVHLGD